MSLKQKVGARPTSQKLIVKLLSSIARVYSTCQTNTQKNAVFMNKKAPFYRGLVKKLVAGAGFEPTTFGL
jgi:hypothetical protein